MSRKKDLLRMQRINCLMQLLIEDLDECKTLTPEASKFKQDIIGFIEYMSTEMKDTNVVQRSTYFQDVTKKIDTVIRQSYNNSEYGKQIPN